MRRAGIESFGDYLARAYKDEMHEGMIGARSVTLQVTDACNLKCTYCYQINKHENYMSLEDAKKFIDMILEGDNEYCKIEDSLGMTLEFIGGEPFLAIDLINEITAYTFRRMYEMNHPWATRTRISICSNGVLYFDKKVQDYIRKYNKLLSFSISIDGNKELHDSCRVFPDGSGSYDKAMAAVKHYRETYGEFTGTKMTLAPANIMHTFEAVKSMIENGYQDINLNCVYEEGWTKKDANIYYYQLKQLADYLLDNDLYTEDGVYVSRFEKTNYLPMNPNDDENHCGGLGAMISINYTGKIFPCIRYMESSIGPDIPEVVIGDLATGIMKSDKYTALVNEMKACTRSTQSTEECFYCPIASGCGWCSGYCYQYYKKFGKRTTFICDTHKAEALAANYYWNKYYLKTKEKDYSIVHCPREWAIEIIPEDEYDMIIALEQEAKRQSEDINI